jgi:cytoskeletal protein CcmA (bactofilin family)
MSEQVTNFHQRSAGSQEVESVIGPTLVIKGEVFAEEDLLIMGFVEGKIDHNQRLTIHAEGSVKATVKAKEIQIDGAMEGDIYGTERVRICETGHVVGNVYAPRVGLMEGAQFKGMVDMDSDAAAIESRFAEQTTNSHKAQPAAQSAKPVHLATAPEAEVVPEAEEAPKVAKAASRGGNRKKKGASKSSTTATAEINETEKADDTAESSEE